MNHYIKKLTDALVEEKEIFNKILDSLIVKLLLSPFTREFMRLNYYMIHKDEQNVIKQALFMETNVRLSKKRLNTLLNTVFEYFVSSGNKKKVYEYRDKLVQFLKENGNHNEIIKRINLSVSVFIDNDISKIPLITSEIEKSNDQEKIEWYITRAHLYYHDHQKDKALQDLNLARNLTNNEMKINQINDIIVLYSKD